VDGERRERFFVCVEARCHDRWRRSWAGPDSLGLHGGLDPEAGTKGVVRMTDERRLEAAARRD